MIRSARSVEELEECINGLEVRLKEVIKVNKREKKLIRMRIDKEPTDIIT